MDEKKPTDDNGDVCPIGFDFKTGVRWGFLDYALAWQYILDWKLDPLQLFPDSGVRKNWARGGLDLDVAHVRAPSQPSVRGPKVRRLVGQVELEQATVQGGQTARAHIVLDSLAPHPNGTVVLVSSDRAEATVTEGVRVPPGAETVGVQIRTVPVTQTTTVRINARALHQLGGAGPSATLTIRPRP